MFHCGGAEENENADPEGRLLERDRFVGFFFAFFCIVGLEEHRVQKERKKTEDEKQLHKKDGQILGMMLDPAAGLRGDKLIHIVEIDATGKQEDDEQDTCDFLVMLIERIGDRLDLLLRHCALQPRSHSHDEKRDSTDPNNRCRQVHPVVEDWDQRVEVCDETEKRVHRSMWEEREGGRSRPLVGTVSGSSVLILHRN